MAEKVAAPANGIQNINDLLALLGGTKTGTTTTGDTGALNNSIAALQGMDPAAQLQMIFQQAAGQIPGLSAARANAVGARTGGNSPLGTSLDKLMQDAAIKAQGQIADQQLKNQQLQIQAGTQVAQSNRNQTQQQGTNLQKAGQLLAIAGGAGKLFDSNIGKQLVGKTKSIWDSVTGSDAALGPISSASPSFDSFGDQSFEIGSAAAPLADSAAGYGSAAFDTFSGFDPSGALDLGGSIPPVDDAAIDLFGGFKNGGLVGRDNKKQQPKTSPKTKNGSDQEMMGYADGGVVQPGKQVNQQSPGGRSGTGASFQLDGITLAQALQSPDELLNPRAVRQLITGGGTAQPGTDAVGNAENAGNPSPVGGYNQGLQGMAGPAGAALGGMSGVPGLGIALSIALGMMDNANQAQAQDAFNKDAIQFANAHEGTADSGTGMGQNSGGGLGGVGTAASAGAPIGIGDGIGLGFGGETGLGMGQGPGNGGMGQGSSGEGGIGGASGDGPGYGAGGNVQGKGTGTSDSISAHLSDGEYVIPADVVQKLGVGFFDHLRSTFHAPAETADLTGKLKKYGDPRYGGSLPMGGKAFAAGNIPESKFLTAINPAESAGYDAFMNFLESALEDARVREGK